MQGKNDWNEGDVVKCRYAGVRGLDTGPRTWTAAVGSDDSKHSARLG